MEDASRAVGAVAQRLEEAGALSIAPRSLQDAAVEFEQSLTGMKHPSVVMAQPPGNVLGDTSVTRVEIHLRAAAASRRASTWARSSGTGCPIRSWSPRSSMNMPRWDRSWRERWTNRRRITQACGLKLTARPSLRRRSSARQRPRRRMRRARGEAAQLLAHGALLSACRVIDDQAHSGYGRVSR